jgi:hypothetical protein
MRKVKKTTPRSVSAKRSGSPFVLGRTGFAKISAVEGLKITAAMEAEFREFDGEVSLPLRDGPPSRANMAETADPRADYDVFDDPYCYKGTSVLKNIPGLRDPAALAAFETISVAQRADEPLPVNQRRSGTRDQRPIETHTGG